jgi:hypothetical protein
VRSWIWNVGSAKDTVLLPSSFLEHHVNRSGLLPEYRSATLIVRDGRLAP